MSKLMKEVARDLRKNQTESEKIFWEAVRGRKFLNKKFIRQYMIKFELSGVRRYFIADFYCSEEKLIIEIDGKIHENQKEYDELRTKIINILGISVVRIKNEEINNTESIYEFLKRLFSNSPL
jgi:very-short-patch-repair endonuclease